MPCGDDHGSGGTRRRGAVGGGGGAVDGNSEVGKVVVVTEVMTATALLAGAVLVLADAWLRDLLLALPDSMAWTLVAGRPCFPLDNECGWWQ